MYRTMILVALLAALCNAALPVLAQAQASDPEAGDNSLAAARAHFRKGVDYYGDGDYGSALLEFERAYELHPTYRLLFNMGQVAYEQRDYIAAERHFADYLSQGGDDIDAERRASVEADIRRLQGRIGRVRLNVDRAGARLFIDSKPVGRSPLVTPVRTSAGPRTVRAELDGYATVDRSVEVVGGEEVEVSLEFGSPLTQGGPLVASDNPYRSESSSAPLWVGIGAGALAVGGGVLAYLAYADQQAYDDALVRNTSRAELNALSDGARQKALAADILIGGALVAGAVTVILLLTQDDDEASDSPATARITGLGADGTVRF